MSRGSMTSPSPSSSSPSSSPSTGKKKRIDWVPLFVSRSSSDLPLATTTLLPPTPARRMSTYDGSSTASSAGSASDPDSPKSARGEYPFTAAAVPEQRLLPGGRVEEAGAQSSGVRMSPHLGGEESGIMQRSHSSGAGAAGAGAGGLQKKQHLRRRSSSSILVGEGILDSAPTTKMERVPSLTTYMSGGKLPPPTRGGLLEHRNSTFHKKAAFDILQRRRRFTNTLFRYISLSLLILFTLYSLRRVIMSIPLVHRLVAHPLPSAAAAKWQIELPKPISFYDTLETVPYPTSSHPRTPKKGDQTAFSDYLSTRLGSHFSFPPSLSHPTHRQSSHLWLTTASNSSVRISTPHLVAFVEGLNAKVAVGHKHDQSEQSALRKLVVVCLDDGCVEWCRERKEWYCFGEFGKDEGEGNEGERGERVKIRATVEALESGRRVFLVDPDVYFKEDPVPYLGALQHYDMQIPDSWHSGRLNAGFAFLQPTQNIISLWRRLLTISLLPPKERRLWSTTNLLLDPFGQARDHRNPHSKTHSKQFSEEDDAVVSGYGQNEFESTWAGGIDVKVLDRKRFRTGSGKLGRMEWERNSSSEAIYHHCVCCGDLATNDYIAGSLGFHHPHASYSLLNPTTKEPNFPQALKTPSLAGTPSELAYTMGFLLQLAADTERVYVPPLKGVIETPREGEEGAESEKKEKYIWRLFPLSSWSHGLGPGAHVSVKEPSFVHHAVQYLHSFSNPSALRQIADLSETLYLDLGTVQNYQQAVRVMKRPFFSTTRVVFVEGIKGVMGKEGWALREEFGEGMMRMCKGVEEEQVDVDGHGEDGKCVEICKV